MKSIAINAVMKNIFFSYIPERIAQGVKLAFQVLLH